MTFTCMNNPRNNRIKTGFYSSCDPLWSIGFGEIGFYERVVDAFNFVVEFVVIVMVVFVDDHVEGGNKSFDGVSEDDEDVEVVGDFEVVVEAAVVKIFRGVVKFEAFAVFVGFVFKDEVVVVRGETMISFKSVVFFFEITITFLFGDVVVDGGGATLLTTKDIIIWETI